MRHERHPGPAVDAGDWRRTGELEQARRHVHGQHLLRDDAGRGRQPRVAHRQRNPDARLVHRPLVDHAVLPLEQAVVTDEDDDGVVQLPAFLEPGAQAADAVVDAEDRAPVSVDHVREVRDCLRAIVGKLLSPLEERAVDAMPRPQAILDPRRLVVQRERRRGIADRNRIERPRVLRLGGVEAVRRLVADDHHPRLVAPITAQPLERDVGDSGRVVPGLDLAALAVEIELGAEILPLTLVGDEVVEAGPGLIVVLAHVILADVGRSVTGTLQHRRKVRQLGRELGEVVGDAVAMGVDATEERSAARRAQRRRAERVAKVDAFAGDAIDVRRPDVGMPGVAERVGAKVVEEDEEDIRPRRRTRTRRPAAAGGAEDEPQRNRGRDRPRPIRTRRRPRTRRLPLLSPTMRSANHATSLS